jgi:hypothetical protein
MEHSTAPHSQGLMMTFKDDATQIIELLPTVLAIIPLAMGWMRMKTTFVNRTRHKPMTAHSVWPAQFTNDCKTFCVIY